jgi:SAM-dependent methyltransferase
MGPVRASMKLTREIGAFLRDSTPERRRQRYGDMEYDWERRVNTTSGSVKWRERLLGILFSPYQPTDPEVFQEMMSHLPADLTSFTFIDVGSGKGRTLLMASEFSFQRIVGVEIVPALHRAAEQNIAAYRSGTRQCAAVESTLVDACEYEFPPTPLVLYLFNPLPPKSLNCLLDNLHSSWLRHPRELWLIYHNPILLELVERHSWLTKEHSTSQFAVLRGAR